MNIRPALADDLAAIVRLTEAAYGHYITLLGGPPLPITEDYAPRIARGEVTLIEEDGSVAGLLVLERHLDYSLIFSVAVAPGFQGKGFGVSLLRQADEQTLRWGLPEVRLFTNARMERNIAIYQAYGYRETGRGPNPYRAGWTLVHMAKPVDQITTV